jgi:hypothetical protein
MWKDGWMDSVTEEWADKQTYRQTCGYTNVTKRIVTFLNFVNAYKKLTKIFNWNFLRKTQVKLFAKYCGKCIPLFTNAGVKYLDHVWIDTWIYSHLRIIALDWRNYNKISLKNCVMTSITSGNSPERNNYVLLFLYTPEGFCPCRLRGWWREADTISTLCVDAYFHYAWKYASTLKYSFLLSGLIKHVVSLRLESISLSSICALKIRIYFSFFYLCSVG